MDIVEVLDPSLMSQLIEEKAVIELAGWLVLLESRLYLFKSDISENYKNEEKVEVSNAEIAFPVIDSVSPLGGGDSPIFFRARLNGFLVDAPQPMIEVVLLSVEDQPKGFVYVDIDLGNIERLRSKHQSLLFKVPLASSWDWLGSV